MHRFGTQNPLLDDLDKPENTRKFRLCLVAFVSTVLSLNKTKKHFSLKRTLKKQMLASRRHHNPQNLCFFSARHFSRPAPEKAEARELDQSINRAIDRLALQLLDQLGAVALELAQLAALGAHRLPQHLRSRRSGLAPGWIGAGVCKCPLVFVFAGSCCWWFLKRNQKDTHHFGGPLKKRHTQTKGSSGITPPPSRSPLTSWLLTEPT